ncbi:PQQ-like beta-propeller repeat protein [Prescottella defluvii]|nr:PQQ-like beta-propeller repeat protein [Prescottella defluvii]
MRTSTFSAATVTSTDKSILWSAHATGAGHRHGAAVHDGAVYVGTQIEDRPAGTVECLDLETGAVRWRARTRSAVKTTPVICDGLVIAAEVSGDVVALDTTTGEERWRAASSDPLRRFAWGAPTLADGTVYLGDPSDLRAIDARTGQCIWHRTDLSPTTTSSTMRPQSSSATSSSWASGLPRRTRSASTHVPANPVGIVQISIPTTRSHH